VAEFCRREQLTVSSFKKWCRRCLKEQPGSQFVELVPPSLAAGRWEVEVALPNGTRLHLRREDAEDAPPPPTETVKTY